MIWARGKTSKIVTTTLDSADELESAGLRCLLVNACYWTTGLAGKIPADAKVDYVGEFKGTPFGFGKSQCGVKPTDLQ